MSKDKKQVTMEDFMADVNAEAKGNVLVAGKQFGALDICRFSSGSVSLDLALGGGWPFSRIGLVVGMESTGKTALMLKAMKSVENYDHKTHRHRDYCEAKKLPFERGKCLFMDVEGTFDVEWATKNGVDVEHHVIGRPEHQQQCIDVVTRAIDTNLFDLIVIDSIPAMVPVEEVDASSEDNQVGLRARKNNSAFCKWGMKLNKLAQGEEGTGPAILCLNHFRLQIGVKFGDPRTVPGGVQQRLSASTIIYTTSPKYESTKDEDHTFCTLEGATKKNKTYIPRLTYSQKYFLKDCDKGGKGSFPESQDLIDYGKAYNLIVIDTGKSVTFGKHVTKTQKEFKEDLENDPTLRRLLWRSIINAAIGVKKI